MKMFDDYFGVPVFDPDHPQVFMSILKGKKRGVRVNALHDLVNTAMAVTDACGIKTDFSPTQPIGLKPLVQEFRRLRT